MKIIELMFSLFHDHEISTFGIGILLCTKKMSIKYLKVGHLQKPNEPILNFHMVMDSCIYAYGFKVIYYQNGYWVM